MPRRRAHGRTRCAAAFVVTLYAHPVPGGAPPRRGWSPVNQALVYKARKARGGAGVVL